MNKQQQIKMRDVGRRMVQLQKMIENGDQMVRWMKAKRKLIDRDSTVRFSIDVHEITHESHDKATIWSALPAEAVWELIPIVTALVRKARAELDELEMPS